MNLPSIEASLSDFLKTPYLYNNIAASLVAALIILLGRYFTLRTLQRSSIGWESKRHWMIQTKNLSVALVFVSLLVIWGSEIRTFAISVVAVAVAIVIATKELILCVLGGLLKIASNPFKIGDRIELAGGIKGDVISHDLLTTKLLEIGPGTSGNQFTGNTIVIPNSLFLGAPIYNHSSSAKFGLHTFIVTRSTNIDIGKHKDYLLQAANEACSQYIESARSYLNKIGEIEGIDAPSADPRIHLCFPAHETVEFIVRIPVESHRAGKAQQEILARYVELSALEN